MELTSGSGDSFIPPSINLSLRKNSSNGSTVCTGISIVGDVLHFTAEVFLVKDTDMIQGSSFAFIIITDDDSGKKLLRETSFPKRAVLQKPKWRGFRGNFSIEVNKLYFDRDLTF